MTATVEKGLASFSGRLLRGREEILDALAELGEDRVGLLGDPAPMTRLVRRLADRTRSLTVFQDEGVWVVPRLAVLPIPGPDLGRLVPIDVRRQVTTSLATLQLRRQVGDPWTRRQLTPRHPPTRHTTVSSNGYYGALRRDDVTLVTWPVAGIVPAGVRTADGLEHHLDVIAVA